MNASAESLLGTAGSVYFSLVQAIPPPSARYCLDERSRYRPTPPPMVVRRLSCCSSLLRKSWVVLAYQRLVRKCRKSFPISQRLVLGAFDCELLKALKNAASTLFSSR